jgi:hypothetical protein
MEARIAGQRSLGLQTKPRPVTLMKASRSR